jgi:hypothetical protein
MSRLQNAGQNHNIKIANRSFENVAQFKYLGRKITNKNFIHEEIKCKLNSRNACYNLVRNIIFSRLISKHLKVKVHKTINLSVVLYGFETWHITIRKECVWKVYEKRVLRRIYGSKRE